MKNKNLLPFSVLLAMLCGGLVVNAPAQDAASAPTASAQNADENKKMNMYVDLARLVLQAKDAEEGAKIINTILDRVAKLSPTEEDLQRNIKEITAVRFFPAPVMESCILSGKLFCSTLAKCW